jgi:hypothetical protein
MRGTPIAHTDEEITSAAARFEKWADQLTPEDFEDASDLRAIAHARDAVQRADTDLLVAIRDARLNHGRSWGQIAIMLGVSRQAAHERFGEKIHGR